MKCNGCGFENTNEADFCTSCNQSLATSPEAATISSNRAETPAPATPVPYAAPAAAPPPIPAAAPATTSPPAQSIPSTYSQTPSYNSTPARTSPYPYQQPYYYTPAAPRPKQPFTITDAYIIIGFVLAVVGVFAYAFILLPASIGFSVVGFMKRRNARTLGLSIAGIVVGVVACLMKIGMVLNELGVIPDWLSAGLF